MQDYVVSRSPGWLCIFICMYIFISERYNSSMLPLGSYNFVDKLLGHCESYFLFIFSYSVWKLHALFVSSIHGVEGKQRQSIKPLCIILYLKRKIFVVKNLFIVCLLLLG